MNFLHNKISLAFNSARNVFVINSFVYFALHHSRSTVILDESFPAGLWHLEMLRESLLTEVLDSIVVRVSNEVLDANVLGMGLQAVHQPGSVPFHLLRGRDCEEDYFCESLRVERTEDAATKDSRSTSQSSAWLLELCSRITTPNDHSFMLTIHGEPYNVIPWHSGQLLCHNVFQINQITH